MSSTHVSRAIFEKRLIDICLRSQLAGLPRKLADRHILLTAVAGCLTADRPYGERELSDALSRWLLDVDGTLQTDHATLRRALVDYGYVARNPSGTEYRLTTPRDPQVTFAPDVAQLPILLVLANARENIARRRQQALASRR